MKAEIALVILDAVLSILWLVRVRLYDLLELSLVVDMGLYSQLLPLILFFCMSAGSLLAVRASRKAQPDALSTATPEKADNPADSSRMTKVEESMAEIKEKLADLHAMATLRQKKAGADS